jgi:hypothetical protein
MQKTVPNAAVLLLLLMKVLQYALKGKVQEKQQAMVAPGFMLFFNEVFSFFRVFRVFRGNKAFIPNPSPATASALQAF